MVLQRALKRFYNVLSCFAIKMMAHLRKWGERARARARARARESERQK